MGNKHSVETNSGEQGRESGRFLSRIRTRINRKNQSGMDGSDEQDGGDNLLSAADDTNQADDNISPSAEKQPNGIPQRTSEERREPSHVEKLFKMPEQEVLEILNTVIHKGKDLNELTRDFRGYSALHLAAERNFLNVAEKMLDYGGNPLACDHEGNIPLHVAFEKKHDAMGALILSKTKPALVRRMFGDDTSGSDQDEDPSKGQGDKKSLELSTIKTISKSRRSLEEAELIRCFDRRCQPEMKDDFKTRGFYTEEEKLDMFDIKKDLIDRDLELSLAAVLDSLAEKNDNDLYTVYIKLLEQDDQDMEPRDEDFKYSDHTVFQTIAKTSKEICNHPVMRMLINKKWKSWCRKQFALNSCLFLFSLFAFTFSIAVGASATSVTVYDTGLDQARAFFEIVTYLFALRTFLNELRQIYRHVLDYWKQLYNWMELLSSLLIVLALPVRYTQEQAHWYILAFAYLLWVVRIFKYAAVFSQTGAYAESLLRILTGDMIQFGLLFAVVNLAFGGTFLLLLKGEDSLQTHDESSSYWDIWLLGLRVMVEAGPVVEYAGSTGYRTVGTIFFMAFAFMTIVVLLNILIAQLSNTYTDIQVDAVKTVRANRAWIITRAERNECKLCKEQTRRVRFYKRVYTNVDMRKLQTQDETQLDEINKAVTAIEKKQVKDALQTLTVKYRLDAFKDKIIDQVRETHLHLNEQTLISRAECNHRLIEFEAKVDNKIDSVNKQLNDMRILLENLLQKNNP